MKTTMQGNLKPNNPSRIYRVTLVGTGVILILISHYYLIIDPPVAVYSGPNAAEGMANHKWRAMINNMVNVPMFALGIMWCIRVFRRPKVRISQENSFLAQS
jgi:hypothetical protein